MKNKIIALVGMTGSGKSEVSKYLESKGCKEVYFGQATLDELKKRNIEVNEKNERVVREDLRKQHGMGAFAILNLPKIKSFLKESNVVIDGLYSWAEYLVLKEEFNDNVVFVAIYSSPEQRYKRLSLRKVRPLNLGVSQQRDYAEIENLDKGGPIAMADITIINDGTLEELHKKVRYILK